MSCVGGVGHLGLNQQNMGGTVEEGIILGQYKEVKGIILGQRDQ